MLVLGAAGGVGLATVELATLMGARVIAAASSAGEARAVRAVRRGRRHRLHAPRTSRCGPRSSPAARADIVMDPVGGPYAEQALRATRWGSRYVVLGFASGEIPRIPLNLVLLKGVIVRGMEMRTIMENEPEKVARDLRELRQLFADGKIHPHVSATYPLGRHRRRPALHARAHRHRQGPHRPHPLIPSCVESAQLVCRSHAT